MTNYLIILCTTHGGQHGQQYEEARVQTRQCSLDDAVWEAQRLRARGGWEGSIVAEA